MDFDSVVVGAGIVGSACAVELARSGMTVALVDITDPGLGATAAGMGHIVVMDDSPAQLALTHYSRQLWDQLEKSLTPACEYRRTGTLWIAADEEEMQEVLRKQSLYTDSDVSAEVISSSRLYELEPALRRGMSGGLLVPDDGVVYAPAVARVLAMQARDAGATLISGRVTSVGSGQVQIESGTDLRTPRIIVAAGEWSCNLVPGLPIRRRKGHLAITDRYPGMVRHQLVELGYLKSAHSISGDSVAFNIQPRCTGQLLIGSSRQYGAEDGTVELALMQRMLERATSYMPALADLSIIRMWTGFRAATPNKLPLIGPWAADETVFLATGHEGLGITTSLATAALLSSWFAGREPAIPIEPYLPQSAAASSLLGAAHA
jgi:glycine/D-amino acid oxidase-like deaminating enzyme